MNSILYKLSQEEVWLEYLNYKLDKDHLVKKEKEELIEFVNLKKYEEVADLILNGDGLTIPEKKLINKIGSNKKRIVYSFKDAENKALKLIAYLLYKYDSRQSPNCFSFRKGFGAHTAINKITNTLDISKMWCYKLDIHNYFNSISIPLLLPILRSVVDDDDLLYEFMKEVLLENKAYYEGTVIEENRGVMAGTPISPFLANIYLKEIDEYFFNSNVLYARYSDDIILFAKTKEELLEYKRIMYEFLDKYDLVVNPEKEKITVPLEEWEFLGVSYKCGKIDLSLATKNKLKGKIRRKARSLRRWKIKKNATDNQTMKVMIKIYNRKFFESSSSTELTWGRWFFPLLNTEEGLREIDDYLQKYIRYIPCGCHSKKNYKTKYSDLKGLGYKSLVNEYYKYKKQKLR